MQQETIRIQSTLTKERLNESNNSSGGDDQIETSNKGGQASMVELTNLNNKIRYMQ